MEWQRTRTGTELRNILPADRIKDRLIDRVSWASDAGFYQLIPQAVVFPENEEDIKILLQYCRKNNKPLVFRAGGSSLSGQSITDGILCVLSRHWKNCQPGKDGKQVRVQPGITGALVNARLKPFQRKIGPDPSSISAAMMGGILSNNASGMCCGVQHNSYHTTRYLRFVLASGNTFSTEAPEDYTRFFREEPALAAAMKRLRENILSNPALLEKIRCRYQTKNTVGYSLNAFVDFEHPLDIFAHLLIGGEGTLAFISEAVLDTIPDLPCRACGLLFFPDIMQACEATPVLNEAGALMVELMDRASLRAVEKMEGMPDFLPDLGEDVAALLVEFQTENEPDLQQCLQRFDAGAGGLHLLFPANFTKDKKQRMQLWKIRKGLFPAVGAVRKSGSSVILEDLAFPLPCLGKAVLELQKLFQQFEYRDAIIFGHARDGNIHFVLSQLLNEEAEVRRYAAFMEEVVALVMRYGGSLKAEHGTGRNMAPFVETEWGTEAYAIMQELKAAADPYGILNPGVILNTDRQAHLRNLKPLPAVEEEVDKCIECGYCEPVCPSRELSSSPRRRIVIRRSIAIMEAAGNLHAAELLQSDQQWEALDTCAVDGLCGSACPVAINTGDLVKRLRREENSDVSRKLALEFARNFGLAEQGAGLLLQAGRFSGSAGNFLTRQFRKIIPGLPLWPSMVPTAFRRKPLPEIPVEEAGFLYFPSCINRILGGFEGGNVIDSFLQLCLKTGQKIREIKPAEGLCCGQVFSSKGHKEAAAVMAKKWMNQIWKESDEGRLPIVSDVSSCTWTIRHLRPMLQPELQEKFDRIQVLDMVDFLHDHILPCLPQVDKHARIWMHPVCSQQKMGNSEKLLRIGRHFAKEVAEPLEGGCCGMAGDRGFLVPELSHSAIAAAGAKPGTDEKMYSCTATCEMALANYFEREVSSVLQLMEEALESK